jgi:hypothetical protein
MASSPCPVLLYSSCPWVGAPTCLFIPYVKFRKFSATSKNCGVREAAVALGTVLIYKNVYIMKKSVKGNESVRMNKN